jgi:hypothetical protein
MSTQMSKPVAVVMPVILFLASLFLSPDLQAGGRRRVMAVPPPTSLSMTFMNGPVLDAGSFSYRGGRRQAAVTTRTFTIRIGEPGARGTATLRGFLETPDPRSTVRVNGIVLTAAPAVILRHVPLGVAIDYRLELEVPLTAAGGPLNTSIGWEATTE